MALTRWLSDIQEAHPIISRYKAENNWTKLNYMDGNFRWPKGANKTSGYRGVSKLLIERQSSKQYTAKVILAKGQKAKYLGGFVTEIEAAKAHDQALEAGSTRTWYKAHRNLDPTGEPTTHVTTALVNMSKKRTNDVTGLLSTKGHAYPPQLESTDDELAAQSTTGRNSSSKIEASRARHAEWHRQEEAKDHARAGDARRKKRRIIHGNDQSNSDDANSDDCNNDDGNGNGHGDSNGGLSGHSGGVTDGYGDGDDGPNGHSRYSNDDGDDSNGQGDIDGGHSGHSSENEANGHGTSDGGFREHSGGDGASGHGGNDEGLSGHSGESGATSRKRRKRNRSSGAIKRKRMKTQGVNQLTQRSVPFKGGGPRPVFPRTTSGELKE